MFWETKNEKQINELNELMKEYVSRIIELEEKVKSKPDKLDKDAYERIADLEVKMAKLWALLIKVDERKNEKLNSFGKKIYGGGRLN